MRRLFVLALLVVAPAPGACGGGGEGGVDAGPDAAPLICSTEGSVCFCSADNDTETPLETCAPATTGGGTCCAANDGSYCLCFAPIECGRYDESECTCRPGPPDAIATAVDACGDQLDGFCFLLHSHRGPRCSCSQFSEGDPEFQVDACDPTVANVCGPDTTPVAACK